MQVGKKSADEIRAVVRAAYAARAREVAAGATGSCCGDGCCSGAASAAAPRLEASASARCCDEDCCGDAGAMGVIDQFSAGDAAEQLPETAVSYGCGNPVAIAGLQPGETVLDLGSGAGLDCFLASRLVGPAGRVIGLDMTDEMLALAEQNRAKLGATNVEFRTGLIEAIPLPDGSVDVIISNCVVNLSPDKDAVFREAFRVLRPGGRLQIADVVLLGDLSAQQEADLDLWAGCVSGALEQHDYAARLAAAGFEGVQVAVAAPATDEEMAARPWQSALITAYRPRQ